MLNKIFICQENMYIKQKSVIRHLKNFPMNVKPAAKVNIANKNRSFFVLYKFINSEIQFTSSFMTLPNAISRVELKGKMIGGRVQQFDNYLTSCFRIYFLLANLSVCLFVYWFVRIYFFKQTCFFCLLLLNWIKTFCKCWTVYPISFPNLFGIEIKQLLTFVCLVDIFKLVYIFRFYESFKRGGKIQSSSIILVMYVSLIVLIW